MAVPQVDFNQVPSHQGVRYLLVGGWNTLFGYSLFSLLTYLLTDRVPYAYMVASLLSHGVNVTVAFLGYRYFVFRTPGNLLRQYLRCQFVYGSTFLMNFALLPILVGGLRMIVGPEKYVPYVVAGFLTLVTALVSFLGHKRFSFAAENKTPIPGESSA